MKTKYFWILTLVICAGLATYFFANESNTTAPPQGPLGILLKEDSATTTALAAYPDSIRKAALIACVYPEALLKMEELQKETKQEFRAHVDSLPQTSQAAIWNITRYQGLTEKLAGPSQKTSAELEKIAAEYPEDVRTDAVKCGTENYTTLAAISELNKSTAARFDDQLNGYPADIQRAFRTLANHPELVELLGKSMRLTVLAGDLYSRKPEQLNHQFDSLNIELAKQKVKETEDWKAGLEKNTAAKTEFEQATKEYESEHATSTNTTTTVVNETVVVNYVCYPYSYWYGYPYWWDYPYWYPYPYWYASGYYYGPYGIVYLWYPTPYYTYWYFYRYPHHHHYCHFSDYYIDHYYGHRRTASPSGRVVENWIKEEQPRVAPNFFVKDVSRPDRIKELGKSEIDRAEYNAQHPEKPVTRDEFVKGKQQSYPNLVVPKPAQTTIPGQQTTPPVPTQTGAPGMPPPPKQTTQPPPSGQPKPSPMPTPNPPKSNPKPPPHVDPKPVPPKTRPK